MAEIIGKVALVGAGPGDPELITLRGWHLLGRADLILYDYLVNPTILASARPDATQICLGRHGRDSLWPAEQIQEAMIQGARQGQFVVRLKSGDPLVFGRAAGEMQALADAGIPFEVVPGVTAGLAAAAYAGIPVTDRAVSSAVAFLTGQEMSGRTPAHLDYAALARFPGTLVFYMGVTTARQWTERLIAAGMPPDCPVALIRRCTWPEQQVIACRLDEVADRVTPYQKFPPPVVAIVGEVARDVRRWNWFEQRPLHGVTVLVTRPAGQEGGLADALREAGAEVLHQPAVQILPPEDWLEVDRAHDRLGAFAWVVFSSANGVTSFCRRAWEQGKDGRHWSGTKLAVVGPGTAEALAAWHLRADCCPDGEYRAESLLAALAPRVAGHRCLVVRGSRGRDVLVQGLHEAGADVETVTAYRNVEIAELQPGIAERLARGEIDWALVTSSSIADSATRLLGPAARSVRWASISPLTSDALRRAGIEPAAEAQVATTAGLLAALRGALS